MTRWLPLLLAAALAVAGCSNSPVRVPTAAPDPFVDAAAAEKGTPAKKGSEFVGRPPAEPQTSTPSGPAEIAPGPSGVSLGAPRSAEPKPREEKSNSVTPASAVEPAPPPGSGAPLTSVPPPTPTPAPSPPPVTYESLQAQLRARGVTWQQLQCMGNDNWHFLCAIPDPGNAAQRDTFEVTRTGNMGLSAIQAVVEQIDRERSAPPPQSFDR